MSRRAPRSLEWALQPLADALAPDTPLAAVQRAWPQVVGDAVAEAARPLAERHGVLTVGCTSAAWAQELDLMSEVVLERLSGVLGEGSPVRLRCICAPIGGESPARRLASSQYPAVS